jgi:hypothetical protein
MSVADVVDLAAGQNQAFRVLGVCGPEGALNIGGDGADASLWAARGSPSDGDSTPEHRFANLADLRVALNSRLLKDGPCSSLWVAFPGKQSSRFQVFLGANGLVTKVEPTQPWN